MTATLLPPAAGSVAPVDNLPSTTPKAREARIVELHDGGLTAARVAKALRMPASSVRSKIHRLRAEGRLAAVTPAAREAVGASRIAAIVEGIEAEAAREAKLARMDYLDATAALKAEYRACQDEIAAREAERLKAIETWRVKMIAQAEGGPIALSDIRDMRPTPSGPPGSGMPAARSS